MSVRKKYSERCERCRMRFELCICAEIPSLQLATKVVVVVSKREVKIPTNTGRLATQALQNSALLVRGDQDQPYDLTEHLVEGGSHLLLYPSDDAQELTAEFAATLTRPCTLVVPDGNWRQTSKMRRRDPGMANLQVVKIAPGRMTEYKVRKESKAEGLATIEAIARALGVLEGEGAQASLEAVLATMVSRTLASRGLVDLALD